VKIGIVGQRVTHTHENIPAQLVLKRVKTIELGEKKKHHKANHDSLEPVCLDFDQHFRTNSCRVPQVSIVVDDRKNKNCCAWREAQQPPTCFLEEDIVEAILSRVATRSELFVFEAHAVDLQTQIVVFVTRKETSHFDFIY
jgi:hypothetical protein